MMRGMLKELPLCSFYQMIKLRFLIKLLEGSDENESLSVKWLYISG